MSQRRSRPPIAVVGVSALFPGSTHVGGFWKDILEGADRIGDIPASHWLIEDYYDPDPAAPDKTYARRGAFLTPVDFDPIEHGVPPTVLPSTDTSQLLALILAKQVLEDATQGQFAKMDASRTSIVLGVTSAQELVNQMACRLQKPVWQKALREQGLPEAEVQQICDRIASSYTPWKESSFPGLLGNVVAGRIANRLNLGGMNCVTDAACASSLSALSMALNELYLGDSDLVITGGVDTMNDIFMFVCFSKTPALSATGDCRPFSAKADGTMLGEGLGFLALKRLDEAERDGDPIYAVIRGLGSSSDGRAASVYAPVPKGQAQALRRAYENAGYGPETVELVEAHGTGTRAGDAAEFEGLRMVFGTTEGQKKPWCALGSVKSQIGHTKAAAGAAGLLKAVLALQHRVLPPTIKVDEPNPAMKIDESPFYLNTQARPWIRTSDHPRRASVSSFGFGGSNFHVTLEEYTGPGKHAARFRAVPAELIPLSAATPAELLTLCEKTAASVASAGALWEMAREAQLAFDPTRPARLAVVASDLDDLTQKLIQARESIAARSETPISSPGGIYYALGATPGKVAFLFPGQGSQYVGMGAQVAIHFEQARQIWDRAADVASREGQEPLHGAVFPIPVFTDEARAAQQARLTETQRAQPAIGLTSLSLLALLRSLELAPAMVGGHSFGEVTALYAAGVLSEEDFLRVARKRGELMANASSEAGAMLAVACSIEEIRGMFNGLSTELVVANHNAPRQVVLSGRRGPIDIIQKKLDSRGIATRLLPVSTAFHSPLVSGSSKPFERFLESIPFHSASCPVYSNAEAAPYPLDPAAMRATLASQIARPVRFVEQVQAMYKAGARVFLEVGPGSVLTQLTGEILSGQPHLALNLDRKGQHGVVTLFHALSRLLVQGVALDLKALWSDYNRPARPVVKRVMTVPISGTNYGKPYPPPGGAADLPPPNPPRMMKPTELPTPPSAVAPPAPAPAAATTAVPPTPTSAPVVLATSEAPAAMVLDASPLAPSLVYVVQEVHRQTAEVHGMYLQSVGDAHVSFLRTVEASLQALSGTPRAVAPEHPARRSFSAPPPRTVTHANSPPIPSPAPGTRVTPPVVAPPPAVAPPAPAAAPPPQVTSPLPPSLVPPQAVTPPTLSMQVPTPTTSTVPAASGVNLKELLLKIVAEKTGYPADMLTMEMALEADLGIDSIKRVEILSALQERVPGLPTVQARDMASLKTLGQIVARLGDIGGGAPAPTTALAAPTAPVAPVTPATLATASTAPGAASEVNLKELLLKIVAEKTGYPADMLTMEMALEADLGIDSIKRVEILSALQERVPGLPTVQARDMASLKTLGQIVAKMEGTAVPFDRAQPAAATGVPLTSTRFEVVTREQAALGLGAFGLLSSGTIYILGDDGKGVAGELCAALRALGLEATQDTHLPPNARAVIFLGGLRDVRDEDEAVAINREAFLALKQAADTLSSQGGLFVSVQDTGGDFGLSGRAGLRAWLGGIPGLIKSAAEEWSGATLRAIDLERADRTPGEIAAALVEELLQGGNEREVGLPAQGPRVVIRTRAAQPPQGPLGIDSTSVVVATGGARGVTAVCLIELARATRARMALLGRSPLVEEAEATRKARDEASLTRALLEASIASGRRLTPAEVRGEVQKILASREVRETLAAIQAAGSEVLYLTADVQDATCVARAMEQVRERFGGITALIHGAGVLADKLLVDKTVEQFDRVFATKVQGLRALLQATAKDPLQQILLFSSVAGRSGNAGQSDYAAANEVLNKVAAAEARRRPGCVVRALGWGPWEGGMVTPTLKAHFQKRGIPLIPLLDGARWMQEEARQGTTASSEVVLGGSPEGLAVPRPGATYEILVNRRHFPTFESHRVQGMVVIPAVMVAEWFLRAARAFDEKIPTEIHDLQVLRGIRVERFEEGIQLHVAVARNEHGLSFELRDRNKGLRYRARTPFTPTKPPPVFPPADLAPWPLDLRKVYGEMLFHGPAFHTIRRLDGVSTEGALASMVGGGDLGWQGVSVSDVPLLDGGLQLARLWGIRALGRPSLPTRLGAVIVHSPGLLRGPLRALLRSRTVGDHRTTSDLAFFDEAGQLAAELRDVDMHMLTSNDTATAASANE
ncbi:MAG: SDR family oxidoreductase [Myxococcales bacterium]|nr:SDR family oxidoreductase [Myxococcales bacterium]